MGARATIGPFVADDCFLRHVDRKRYLKNGIVSPEVFKERYEGETLSFTYQHETLRGKDALDEYQIAKVLPSGDLPGLCRLTFGDLTVKLDPPLPPRPQRDDRDEIYGEFHCVADSPADDVHRRKLAHLAELNGIVRAFIPKEKRKG